MARTKKVKASGKYGAKHGRRVRTKITEIEASQRKKQKCIFCNGTAKKISKGIWECKKCNKKFAHNAYILPKE